MSIDQIQTLARKRGLELELTGSGGFDQLILAPGGNDHPVFVLENPLNGEGPADPAEKIGVLCYPNMERWTDSVEAIFPDANSCLEQLADPDFRAAMIWEMSGLVAPGKALEAIMESVSWSEKAQAEIRKQDFSFAEMAQTVLQRSGAEVVSIPHPG